MTRCAICNEPLKWGDYKHTKPDGTEGDICSVCRDEINNIDIPEHKSYMFEDIYEGVKSSLDSDY